MAIKISIAEYYVLPLLTRARQRSTETRPDCGGVTARSSRAGDGQTTHYSAYGAEGVAASAVQEISRLQLPLADWLR